MKKYTSDKPIEGVEYISGRFIRGNLVALDNGQIVNCSDRGTEGKIGKFVLDTTSGFPIAILISSESEQEEASYERDIGQANGRIVSDYIKDTQGYQFDNRPTFETPDGSRTSFTFKDASNNQITTPFISGSLHVFLNGLRQTEGVDYIQDSFGCSFYSPPAGDDIIIGDFRIARPIDGLLKFEDFTGEA